MDSLDLSYLIISIVLIVFLLIDAVLLYVVNKYGLLINNNYFNFHKKYGLIKVELIKLVFACILIYSLHHASGKPGGILSLTVLFCVYVINLIRDFIKQKKEKGEWRYRANT